LRVQPDGCAQKQRQRAGKQQCGVLVHETLRKILGRSFSSVSISATRMPKRSAIALIFFGVAQLFYLHVLTNFKNI
jgi:hypothetical protein